MDDLDDIESGWHALLPNIINQRVEQGRIGIYLLGYFENKLDDLTEIGIGRSDHDNLNGVLHQQERLADRSNDQRIRAFKVEYHDNENDAYQRQCVLFHRYCGEELIPDTRNHPPSPTPVDIPCPVSGCPYPGTSG